MILVLKRDNLIKIIYDWGYPFSPNNYQYINSLQGQVEYYTLVGVNQYKTYRVNGKLKPKAYYRFSNAQPLGERFSVW